MTLAPRTASTVVSMVATAGLSTLLVGAGAAGGAAAAPGGPCDAGVLLAPGVCEQSFTSGTSTFIPTADMTKLEALLVGAGGAGADQSTPNTQGYAAGGGGGEVRLVDFSATTDPLVVTVAAPGVSGNVTAGTVVEPVANGAAAFSGSPTGATSGTAQLGWSGVSSSATPYGGGGGAAASPANGTDGGAGVIVGNIAPSGSLFTGSTACYGGGGAIGVSGIAGVTDAFGIPGCGGGGPTDASASTLVAPIANSGGGGGGLAVPQAIGVREGASGVVVLRWNAPPVTLSFDVASHGTAPASQSVIAGFSGARPADPTAEGFVFGGWFLDSTFATPADFSAPLTGSATFHAKWLPAIAESGFEGAGAVGASVVALGALLAGASLMGAASRRRATD